MEALRIMVGEAVEERVPQGTRVVELLAKTGVKDAVAARLDDRLVDLATPLVHDATLTPLTKTDPAALDLLRHSTSHIMAQAVRQLFPGVKVTIGPSIEAGFYYDFDYEGAFTPEDLPRIEARMAEIIRQGLPFVRKEVGRREAVAFFKAQGEPYKVELLDEIKDDTVSLYEVGDFTDLCRGPHIASTDQVPAFKLLDVSGSYWRGDERRERLQRIYGTAFFSKKELEEHLHLLEEAKKRDHRKLGRELDLFSLHDEVGAGLVIWHPNGALLRTLIEDFEKAEHLRRGYHIVFGPQILKMDLWQASGHLENYGENMYFTQVDDIAYGIKPMNCLAHMFIYKSRLRSYRDLPLRYFELGTVFRHEKSGVLHGLTRVRQFTQDDAHLICTPDQLVSEIQGVMRFVSDVMDVFGFEFEVEISTRPEKSIGTDEDWEQATSALMQAVQEMGLAYDVNPGDGAFYGPKIDVKLKDALNRRWQCATIQCDFTLPDRFGLTYVAADGSRQRPAMIHRTLFGSLERFIGVLIEHCAGAFPAWLSPVQVLILTVTSRGDDYANQVCERLRAEGIRAETDLRNEKLGFKIREAQLQKMPYMLIIGDRELAQQGVSPRTRGREDLGFMTLEAFIERARPEMKPPSFH